MAIAKKPLAAALGAAFLATSISPMVSAEANPFSAQQLGGGYDLANYDKHMDGKCGEGNCGGKKAEGEGSCGGAKAHGEGSCGGAKADGEGSCGDKKAHGEGTCGGSKAAGEGSSGDKKADGEGETAEGK